MSDLIRELLDNHEGRVDSGMVEELGEIKAMLRDCLDRLGARETRPVETGQAEARLEPKGEAISGFEDNPWVQILRAKSGGGRGSQVA